MQPCSAEFGARLCVPLSHQSLRPTPSPPPVQASFPYIGIADLRAVPLAVLSRLQPVPASFLKQLATDKDLFWDLPVGVQRQVGWRVAGWVYVW